MVGPPTDQDRVGELAELGRRLREARRAKHLTQAELASLAGINRVTLAHVERGAAEVGVLRLRRLAEALGISAGQLLD